MTLEELNKLFVTEKTNELAWEGECHDCGKETTVVAIQHTDDVSIFGGAVYSPKIENKTEFFLKCPECLRKDPVLRKYQPNEIYSRVVGYMRPVSSWNEAKRSEFKMRQAYKM